MSNYPTRKSFKSLSRDRLKHSGKVLAHTTVPRKAGHGSGPGNAGKLGSELHAEYVTSTKDPNYDEMEEYYDSNNDWMYTNAQVHQPSPASTSRFQATLQNYAKFKSVVRDACREYLTSRDALDFQTTISDLNMPLFLQDLPEILIKYSLDRSDEDRAVLSTLLGKLKRQDFITPAHFTHSIHKLTYALPELSLDCPAARTYLKEFAQFGLGSGLLAQSDLDAIEEYDAIVKDSAKLTAIKEKLADLTRELFSSEDLEESLATLRDLNLPHSVMFEVPKVIVRSALDHGNRQREVAAQFLAFASLERVINMEDMEKGFTVLLERVEDLSLDVKDVLSLLSTFIARAVNDEIISPGLLSRVDVSEHDLGAQVLNQAQEILSKPDRDEVLERCWRGERKPSMDEAEANAQSVTA